MVEELGASAAQTGLSSVGSSPQAVSPADAASIPSAGWIEWSGGECPVASRTWVEVKFRDGMTEELYADSLVNCSGRNWWKHEGASYEKPVHGRHHADVIAYRVVS